MAKSSFFSSTGITATNTNVIQASVNEAANSATLAEQAFDAFDDRYLGQKSSPPSTDNDGNLLVSGTLYFDTSLNEIRIYKSNSGWEALTAAGSLQIANNLSDLNNTETARSNLSLGDSTQDTYYIKSRASSGTAIKVEGTIEASGSMDATAYKRSGTTFLDPTGSLTNVTLDAGNF